MPGGRDRPQVGSAPICFDDDHLEDVVGGGEDVARERRPSVVAEVGVAHHDVGERVVLQLVEEVETLSATDSRTGRRPGGSPSGASKTKLKVEPSMPPKAIFFSARPPIQRSTSLRPPSLARPRCPCQLRKSRRSAGAPGAAERSAGQRGGALALDGRRGGDQVMRCRRPR